jgi:p-methyltransferase
MMSDLDVIIIADYGVDSVSGSNPLKFTIDGRIADIEVVSDYVQNNGQLSVDLTEGGKYSWSSAYSYNGIKLLDYLLKQGMQVELINDFSKGKEAFRQLLSRKPKLVALSTTFILDKETLQRFHDDVRALSGSIPLIVGGPFIFASYLVAGNVDNKLYQTDEIKSHFLFQKGDDPEFDLYIISPAGEDSVAAAVRGVINGSGFDLIPNGLVIVEGESVVLPEVEIRAPGLDLIDWQNFPAKIFSSKVVPMQASRGCPFQCAFCNFVKDVQLQAVRSVSDIIEEMKIVESRGVEFVWFVDDIFRLGHGNLDQFSNEVINAGIRLQWMSFIRADTVKGVDFDLLKKAGCVELQLGLESASTDVLEVMNKKANPETYRQVIQKALQAGINISAYFIFGHPGETEATVNTTIEFIREAQHPDLPGAFSWSFYPYLLVPLSPLFEAENRHEFDLHGYMNNWSHRTMNSNQALQQIKKAFMTLKETGPIYRGDNLRMLEEMPAEKRREFYKLRHRCAQLQQAGNLPRKAIVERFRPLFSESFATRS